MQRHRPCDRLSRVLALAFLAGSLARPARAQDFPLGVGEADRKHDPAHPAGPASGMSVGSWLERDHLLGDFDGARERWSESGVELELLASSEFSRLLDGGLEPHETMTRRLVDVQGVFDAEKLWGLPGGELLVLAQYQAGDDGGSVVGDSQGYSNIDADGRAQVSKLWWYQEFPDQRVWGKFGKIDANSDFAYTEHGASFLNSSMGYSPTILGFPTFPDPSFGAQLFAALDGGWSVGAGVFDGAAQTGVHTGSRGPATLFGAPDDLFLVAEVGCTWERGRVGVGAWRHTGEFPRFDGGDESGTDGAYLVLDQSLLGGPDDESEFGAFAQLGSADGAVSELTRHVGLGLTWSRRHPRWSFESLGLAVSSVDFSDAAGAGFSSEREVVLELFVSFVPAPWLRIKPDLQWIDEPGGRGADDALVATVRATVSL